MLHCFFVEVHAAYSNEVVSSPFHSFFPEVIGNPHVVVLTVNVISEVYTMHPSFA